MELDLHCHLQNSYGMTSNNDLNREPSMHPINSHKNAVRTSSDPFIHRADNKGIQPGFDGQELEPSSFE